MPLAARSLEITVSAAPDLSGRVGAALMAIEGFLDEDSVAPGAGPLTCGSAPRGPRPGRRTRQASTGRCGSVTSAHGA